jgi:hypothetical protein
MFTEYHLEKIIQAINDAEERQTKALLEAIKSMKAETIVDCTPEKKVEIEIHPDLFTDAEKDALDKAIENSRVVPANKPTATKKPTSKKPAPVRGRN